MPFIIDIFLLLILAAAILIGLKRGFFKTLVDMFSTLIAFGVAYFTYRPVAGFVSEKYVLPKIAGMIKDLLTSNGTVNDIARMFTEKKNFFISIIDRFSDMGSVESYYNTVKDGSDAIDKVSAFMAAPISTAVCRLAAFLAIFLIAVILIKVIAFLVGLTLRLPVLKQADSALGAVLGAVIGLLIIWVLSIMIAGSLDSFIALFPKAFPEGKVGKDILESTLIMRILYGISPAMVIKALIR